MRLVVFGLSLSSSWGNGHATTYRGLLKAFAERGHDVVFLERDQPWYKSHRDLVHPSFCRLEFYDDLRALEAFEAEVRSADAVLVGSYTPDGVAVGAWARRVFAGPLAFYDIDTPITLSALEAGSCAYLHRDQIPEYDVYLSFTGGPTLMRLERCFGSPAAEALFCSADPDLYRPLTAPTRWDLSYLGTYSADRQPALQQLLINAAVRAPQRRFVVAGPQYPDTQRWPPNVERIDHVPPADHPAFYAASRFTLNLTRADMREAGFSPSIRLFEAGACGVPILSDVWPGLEEMFRPGEEILLVRRTEEVLAALALADPERRRIAEGGRDRVLQDHTTRVRAEQLERALVTAADRRRSLLSPWSERRTSGRDVEERSS